MLFIVNEIDRPCARLIAERLPDGKARYIDRRIDREIYYDPARAVPVADFGVIIRLSVNIGYARVASFSPSIVPGRLWQPEHDEKLWMAETFTPWMRQKYADWIKSRCKDFDQELVNQLVNYLDEIYTLQEFRKEFAKLNSMLQNAKRLAQLP